MDQNDMIYRQAAINIPLTPKGLRKYQTFNLDDAYDEGWGDYQACVSQLPSAQPEIVRCKDCKHRPERPEGSIYYEDLNFPDGVCPCQCDDYFYSYMPDDDWFCKNGERKED